MLLPGCALFFRGISPACTDTDIQKCVRCCCLYLLTYSLPCEITRIPQLQLQEVWESGKSVNVADALSVVLSCVILCIGADQDVQ